MTHDSISLRWNWNLFQFVFICHKSDEKLDIPLLGFPKPKLNSFALRSSEVETLLLNLDSIGAIDPNGVSPFFYVKTADFMTP